MDRDPLDDARALVRERYPQAVWAVLAGSVLTAHRTAGSDLDIVVVLPVGDPLAPRRESLVFRGWPVELFVHDDETLDWWLAKERPQRKPTLHRMVCGTPVVGDPADRREACRAVLDTGPEPMAPAQLEAARYGLTDLLDDLEHATDPGERHVIAATLWANAAHGALVAANRWTAPGNGCSANSAAWMKTSTGTGRETSPIVGWPHNTIRPRSRPSPARFWTGSAGRSSTVTWLWRLVPTSRSLRDRQRELRQRDGGP